MVTISSVVKQITGFTDLENAVDSFKNKNYRNTFLSGTIFAAKAGLIGVCATYVGYHSYSALQSLSAKVYSDVFEEFKYLLTRNIKSAKDLADKCLQDDSVKGCKQVNEKALSLLFEHDTDRKDFAIGYAVPCLERQSEACKNVNKEAFDLFIEKYPKPIYAAECIDSQSEACQAVNARVWPRFVEILNTLKSDRDFITAAEIIDYTHKCLASTSEISKKINQEVYNILKNIPWTTGFNGFDEYTKKCVDSPLEKCKAWIQLVNESKRDVPKTDLDQPK